MSKALVRTIHPVAPGNPEQQLQGIIHPHAHDSFRDFELSLQSPLHPSITLLVHYRSHTGIQPYQGYTWQFELQSQGALLVRHSKPMHPSGRPTIVELQHGAVTLDSRSIPDTFASLGPDKHVGISECAHPASQREPDGPISPGDALPLGWVSDIECRASSLAVTGAIAVAFSSCPD